MLRITHTTGALLAFVTAILSGCGSTQVSDLKEGRPAGAPDMIYVANFDLGAATLKSDPGSVTGRTRVFRILDKDPATELEQLQDLLAKTLVDDLHNEKLPARRLVAGGRPPQSGWVVGGEFFQVDEGNRMQKAVVGFGAGNSQTTLVVSVADLSQKAGNLLNFNLDSKGDTGPSGAGTVALTHEPYAMAAKFVMNRDASEKDVKRAAGEIAQRLRKLAEAAPPK